MRKKLFFVILCLTCLGTTLAATQAPADTTYTPTVIFTGMPKAYEIADIKVEGADNYDDYIIIGY
ncbi:MAG: hypothetical protein K2H58_07485, partial [Paramuribaculum sp.]|nr:hypothetical protein [Paramuribaculum sp.]